MVDRLAYVFVILTSITAQATVVPIDISIPPHGQWGRPWPVSTGVPFPAGVLKDAGSLAVIDDQQRPVAASIKACWPWRTDGSVQWVNVSFLAEPGRKYRLMNGGEKAASSAATIPLLKFADGGLASISAGETPVLGKLSQRMIDSNGVTYAAVTRKVSEESKQTMRESGAYLDGQGKEAALFDIRYTTWPGQSLVRVEHVFTWLSDVDKVKVRDIAMEFALPGAMDAKQVCFGPEGTAEGVTGKAVALKWPGGGEAVGSVQEVFRHYGNLECKAKVYGAGGKEMEQIAGGVAWDGSHAVAMALADFWQQFPKEWEVRADRVVLHLWSAKGGSDLDFTFEGIKKFWDPQVWALMREKGYGGGALGWLEKNLVKADARGLQKRHVLWIDVKPTTAAPEAAAALARLADAPPYASPDPAWTCASGALNIPVAPREGSAVPELERLADELWQRTLALSDLTGDYGWWAYGGGPHFVYLIHEGRPVPTSYRFYNEDYFRTHNGLVQYFRTGDRMMWDWLRTRLDHLIDIEVQHVDGLPGQQTRKGHFTSTGCFWAHDDDSADTMVETIGVSLESIMWAYAMTGDERWRELVQDWAARLKSIEPGTEFHGKGGWPEGYIESHAGYTASWARGVITCMGHLAVAYEATGDEKLKEMCSSLGKALLDPSKPAGFRPTIDMYVQSELYYVTKPFLAYHRVTGDQTALDTLKRALLNEWMLNVRGGNGASEHWAQDNALGYQLTGDRRYLEEAVAAGNAKAKEYAEAFAKAYSQYEEGREIRWASPNEFKDILAGVPMLAGVLPAAAERVGPIKPAERYLPLRTNEVVFMKETGKPATADLLAVGAVKLVGPDGAVPEKSLPAIPFMQEMGKTLGHYVTLQLPADAPAGPWRLISDREFFIVRAEFPQAVASATRGIGLRPGDVCYLAPGSESDEVTSDAYEARHPDKLHFTRQDKVVRIESDGDNYIIARKPSVAWLAYGNPSRAFIPSVAATMPAPLSPVVEGQVSGPTPALAKGRVLRSGERLALPLFASDMTKKPGALEFWLQLRYNPFLLKKEYSELGELLAVGDLHVRLNGGKGYHFAQFYVGLETAEGSTFVQKGFGATPGEWQHVAITWYPVPGTGGKKLQLVCAINGVERESQMRDIADMRMLARTNRKPTTECVFMGPVSDEPAVREGIAIAGVAYYDHPRHVNLAPPKMMVTFEPFDPATDVEKPTVFHSLVGATP